MESKNKPDSPRWWGCEMSKCKYCEIAKSECVGVRVFEDLPIDWDNSNGGSATMIMSDVNGEHYWLAVEAVLYPSEDDGVNTHDINYCPMCGRKLSEVVVDE